MRSERMDNAQRSRGMEGRLWPEEGMGVVSGQNGGRERVLSGQQARGNDPVGWVP